MNLSQKHPETSAERLLTVDTAGLVAVVRTVVNFVTLFGAVDAGSVTTLELIRPTCEQSCRTHANILTITAKSSQAELIHLKTKKHF